MKVATWQHHSVKHIELHMPRQIDPKNIAHVHYLHTDRSSRIFTNLKQFDQKSCLSIQGSKFRKNCLPLNLT